MRTLALVVATLCTAAAGARAESIPVDVGVGPAAYLITGPVQKDQLPHTGLKISVQAILDRAFIAAHEKQVPKKYRAMARRMDEVRFSPSIFIPDALIISPRWRNTSLYGVTWRPVGVSLPLVKRGARVALHGGLLLTYAWLASQTLPTTHFLRPGLDLGASLEVPLTQRFGVSLGWSSGLYVPQKLGSFVEYQPLDQTMWHLGQAFLQLHYRFPFKFR